MRSENISVLQDTLAILDRGFYEVDEKRVELKLNREEMRNITVYLPDDIDHLKKDNAFHPVRLKERMLVGCENRDSFSQARISHAYAEKHFSENKKPVLVLNLANPVHPGGGVRRGAKAQEEDLCRKSSLLLSLESDTAGNYYRYNAALHTYLGSDAVMITPKVEIIKDENGRLLEDSVIVSVMTCAAPMLRYGMEGLSNEEYRALLLNRVTGMLKIAAHLDYRVLVLGAFGCGAFHNDARIVSNIFYKALNQFMYYDVPAKKFFYRIDFAVLDRSTDQYNLKEFSRNFSNFYREELKKRSK